MKNVYREISKLFELVHFKILLHVSVEAGVVGAGAAMPY
jgi:hypothetical protein